MYSQILVPVDLDEPSSWEKAVPVGLAMAAAFGAEITLCTVLTERIASLEAQWTRTSYEALLKRAAGRLAGLADELRGDSAMKTQVGMGNIYGGILAVAEDIEADLVVLASHRPEMKDWLIGANASKVVRHASCSVLVVRE